MSLKTVKLGFTTSDFLINGRPGFEGVIPLVPPRPPSECNMLYYQASLDGCFQDEAGLVPVIDDGNAYPVKRLKGFGWPNSDLIIKPYQTGQGDDPMIYIGFGWLSVIVIQADCYAESPALQSLLNNRSYITVMMKANGAEMPSLSNYRDIPIIGFTAGQDDVFKIGIGSGHCPAPRGSEASNLWEWRGDAAGVLRWKDTGASPVGDNILELGSFTRLGNDSDVYLAEISAASRQPRAEFRMNIARDLVNSEIPAVGKMSRNLNANPRLSTAAGVMKFEAGSYMSALAFSTENMEMDLNDKAAALAWMQT